MSADRIAQLHEQASEHYLNANYEGALQAWRDVLALDPENEQAMDGVRMASQFAAPVTASASVSADVDQELDQGLRVFDSLGSPATDRKPAPAAASTARAAKVDNLARNNDGIDFGDLSDVGAIPLGATDAPPIPSMEPAPEPVPEPAPEEDFGLALSSSESQSAAAVELNRRVTDLLNEAQAKADAGEKDEALSILSRLAILDDENAEAAALRDRLLEGGPSDLDRIEQLIIEGVAALESDRLDEAERNFRDVLAISPDHREAEHYLQKAQERRAGVTGAPAHDGEDLLGGGGDPFMAGATTPPAAPPANEAVPLAPPVQPGRGARSKSAPGAADAPVQPTMRGSGLPSMKWVVMGGFLAIAGVCAFIAMPHLMSGGKPAFQAPPPAAKPRPAPGPTAGTAVAPAMSAAERDRTVAASLAQANQRMAAGDFGGAVVSFNEALRADPMNLDAKRGLNEAGERYKERKAEQDALEAIKLGFRDGEYTSALRLAYRLPPTIPESYISAIKAAGWYNLAIVALRAGDCREAISHLDEVLAVNADDADATKLREFASAHAEAPKDRAFLDYVEALPFRPLPAS